MKENRMGLPSVGSPEKNYIRFLNLLIGVRATPHAKNHRQTGDAWGVSSAVALIDIVTPNHPPRELLRNEVHLVGRLRTAKQPKRLAAVLFDDRLQTARSEIQSLIPGRRTQNTVTPVVAYEGLSQPDIWLRLRHQTS